MLFHVSSTPDIKVLEPRVSTHGKAYVYAIENLVTGLLFGAKKDDFDLIISTDEAGFQVAMSVIRVLWRQFIKIKVVRFMNCRKKVFNVEKQAGL